MFNDVFLFIVNIIVDLFLFKYFKEDIQHKFETRGPNADNSNLIKSKKNIDRMLILTGLIFFLSHMPEFCVTLMRLIFRENILKFCENYNTCGILNDEARFFTLISVVFQFYILLLYNRNFRDSFGNLFDRIKFFCCKK